MRPENPFRFLVLDDPVQAFDGGRVRYIAGVLAEIARDYQVIVLTHDERLPNELRNSGVGFTRIALERAEDSSVSVEAISSPAHALLKDAFLIANTHHQGQLDDRALAVTTLSLCRQAIDEALSAAYGTTRMLRPQLASMSAELEGWTTRQRWTNLNAALRDADLAEVACTDQGLMNLVNDGSHFNPPNQCGKSERVDWVHRAEATVRSIEGVLYAAVSEAS
jgi:hypothetical protein